MAIIIPYGNLGNHGSYAFNGSPLRSCHLKVRKVKLIIFIIIIIPLLVFLWVTTDWTGPDKETRSHLYRLALLKWIRRITDVGDLWQKPRHCHHQVQSEDTRIGQVLGQIDFLMVSTLPWNNKNISVALEPRYSSTVSLGPCRPRPRPSLPRLVLVLVHLSTRWRWRPRPLRSWSVLGPCHTGSAAAD